MYPAGKYIIKTWHEKLKTVSQEVIVPEEGEVGVELSLKRGRPDKKLYSPEE